MIAIGSDHCGYALKMKIEAYLDQRQIAYKDFGCPDAQYCQYPIYGYRVANAVCSGECDRGLLFCGTGMGMAIIANKFPGVRAAVCSDPFTAKMAKMHNNANVLTMGGFELGFEKARMILDEWLDNEYELRHNVRLDMIAQVEDIFTQGKENKEPVERVK